MKNEFSSSNWTGRTPRSLNDAFGPHTSPLLKAAERQDRSAVLVAVAIGVAVVLYVCWWLGSGRI